MRRTILMLGLAWSLSFPAAAHQCVLEGSTSEAIQSYNACKLDLATGQSGHGGDDQSEDCLLYTSPSPRDRQKSRMPSSA